MRVRVPPPALAAFVVGAAVVLAVVCSRVTEWAVMTDELLYERLALSIAETGSPLPTLRGELVGSFAILYPLLLAPVFALVDLPGAVRVAHGVNGVLFASAAIPAYLLARELALPRGARYASALFAVAIPWTVVGAFLMTEAAAYAAFLWAALAVQRALAEPSRRRDAIALGAVAVASLARPQLLVLAPVFALAALVQEARYRRWRAHVALWAAAGAALLLALVGGAGLLGTYAAPLAEGGIVSPEIVRSAVVHLNVVGIALGIVPLLLGGAWALSALARPPGVRRHAFAALVAVATPLLALQTASVVERFGLGVEVKDRYLFYVAPLLFAATATALDGARPRLVALLALTVVVVLTVGWEPFEPVFGVSIDSPASSTHEALTRAAAASGMAAGDLIAVAVGVVAVALVAALRRAPERPLAIAVLALVLGVAVAHSAYTWHRLLVSSAPTGRPLTVAAPPDRSWVDRAVSRGTVAMLPHPVAEESFRSASAWWDVEFWNARVQRAYLVGGRFAYTPPPFPHPVLRIDEETGAVTGAAAPDYVVRTTLDARFRPAGITAALTPGFELVDVEIPFRAAWLTRGLWDDGWTHPARAAVVRVFPPEGVTLVRATVDAPDVAQPRHVSFGGAPASLTSRASAVVEVEVCVRRGGYADVPVVVQGSSTVPDVDDETSSRSVGIRLSRIEAVPTGRGCPP